jgi:hypothetical protein
MSSSIAIPKRKQPSSSGSGFASASSSSASPYPSWANNAASSSFSPSSLASSSASPSSASTPSSMARYAERRPSLLGMSEVPLFRSAVTDECIGDSLSKSEYTVVNIGGPENPRLVSKSRLLLNFGPRLTRFIDYMYQDISRLRLEPGYAEVSSIIPRYIQLMLIADIFLPSYLDYDSSDLEHRPDPVQEIILTDEEAAAILPK